MRDECGFSFQLLGEDCTKRGKPSFGPGGYHTPGILSVQGRACPGER